MTHLKKNMEDYGLPNQVENKRVQDLKLITFRGEKANVTRAFAPKLTRTAILSPRPLNRKGNTSDIMSQPIGPKEIWKYKMENHAIYNISMIPYVSTIKGMVFIILVKDSSKHDLNQAMKNENKKKLIHLITAYVQQQTNYSNNSCITQEDVIWTQKE